MRWEGNRQSDNVEDRRGDGGGGGGGGGFSIGGGKLGIGGVVVALVLSYVFGVSPTAMLGMVNGGAPVQQQAPTRQAGPDDRAKDFVQTVLADTEDVWGALFQQQGETYVKPTVVLFSGRTQTACGTGQSATGPFYCPPDQKVYIDLEFFDLMQQRFHVAGEFAQAYVLAHEVGHHVQNLMGLSDKVHSAQQRLGEAEGNALSVKLELQADCFAGVWAFHANQSRKILEQGDIETALAAATAIGDDALQRQSQGHVVPDSFTHGTSAQRVRWFRRGIDSGEIAQCETFKARQL